MNDAVFRALKPGGAFVVIDHSARGGAGSTEAKRLHRVEESVVRDEIVSAGFRLASVSDFLRNPSDTRDWNVFDESRRGTTDRFALRFVRP